ncbi:MAG: class I SAM-dependent methyltransferase family protein [Candidatus Thermoplasmatota archaeon]|nr:class I SAM-dependent methyltransferase family protein [Candidatus Thermoplasmatota archaeon]
MLGVRVPKGSAEAIRLKLTRSNLVDKRFLIIEEDGFVIIPVLQEPDERLLADHCAQMTSLDFPTGKSRVDPIETIRKDAEVPDTLRGLLPDKWEQFGDVVVIRLPKALDGHESSVGDIYARVLGVKAVLRDTGGVTGMFRMPIVKTIHGSDTVTIHKENGILYKFDAARLMFSSGNVEERLRMSEIMCNGETIVDMFAGIGYFSLPLAVNQLPKKVISCEMNEISYSYLLENVRLNDVEGVVEPILGDNRELPGDAFADRVIMGYVKTTHEFLPTAMRLVKDGGMIHYHETCPNELLPGRPVQRLRSAARNHRVEVLRFKEIKSYSPGVSHVVLDARVVKSF